MCVPPCSAVPTTFEGQAAGGEPIEVQGFAAPFVGDVDEDGNTVREEPGVQNPAQTLFLGQGSCRDFAALFIEGCRSLGLASRFVSGYLVSSAAVEDLATTHAWAEVYLPGTGWRGFDSTGGQLVGGDHIAVAVHRHPEAIPPVSGSFIGPTELKPIMEVQVQVQRL